MVFSIKLFFRTTVAATASFVLLACSNNDVKEVNIGFIGPLSERAVDLGIGPSKAIELAIHNYNEIRKDDQPKVNLSIEDDKWEKNLALPAYSKLKQKGLDVLFISNTGGTVALQDSVMNDGVIMINQINSDRMLSSLNRNTFKIAKRTEDTHQIIGGRIAELKLKNILIYHFPNDFMTRGAKALESSLEDYDVRYKTIEIEKGQVDFKESLKKALADSVDGIAFLGYRNFGFAMRQARELGITAKFFGSTTLFDPVFYDNSEGHIKGTECTYFTEEDGDLAMAKRFVSDYVAYHGERPGSIWPAMQAYDAANIVLEIISKINEKGVSEEEFEDWLRSELHDVTFYKGVCGNISIGPDGASKGIYFSMYKYEEKGRPVKITD